MHPVKGVRSVRPFMRFRVRFALRLPLAAIYVFTAAVTAIPATSFAHSNACSGASFTWTGNGGDSSWADAKNWNPSTRAPGSCSGDSVDIPVEANIIGMPNTTLANLTIDASAGNDGTLGGGPVTITGSLTWDAGSIDATVTVPRGATGSISGPATDKSLGSGLVGLPGRLNTYGTLALANLSGSGGRFGLGAGASRGLITVEPDGTLSAHGSNEIDGTSCCGGTNVPTVENKGTIDVTSGDLILSAALFHQLGHTQVAAHSMINAQAPVDLGPGSSYAGSGEVLVNQGAFPSTVSGTLDLEAGSHLDLGAQACLAGSGTITGPGSFDFSGGDLAAKLTIAAGAQMNVIGPGPKDLRAFGCGTADGQITNRGSL